MTDKVSPDCEEVCKDKTNHITNSCDIDNKYWFFYPSPITGFSNPTYVYKNTVSELRKFSCYIEV